MSIYTIIFIIVVAYIAGFATALNMYTKGTS